MMYIHRKYLAALSMAAVVFPLLLSCPMIIPDKVRVKANPAVYMPLGSPESFSNIDFNLSGMAESSPGAGGDTVVCDYPGEFPETRAFLAWTKLVEHTFPVPGVPAPPPGAPSVSIPSGVGDIQPGSAEGMDLSPLQDILIGYDGLKFKSVIGYLYFNGPATLLRKGGLSLELGINNGTSQVQSGTFPLSSTPLPDPLPSGEPVTRSLSPKPAARIDLTDVLNDRANGKINFDYTISGQSAIEIPVGELPAFLEELKTPLTVYLAIVLPFRFTSDRPVPVLVGDSVSRPDSSAIIMDEGGKDLFGRDGGGTSDTLQKVLNNMSAINLTISVTNRLGINGFLTMNREVTPVGDRPENPLAPMPDALGRISLSGNSAVTLTKAEVEEINPLNPVFELFLEGDFEIKRPAADEKPGEKPLEMSLGVVVQTAIDKVFP
jgi:hypothetical protein